MAESYSSRRLVLFQIVVCALDFLWMILSGKIFISVTRWLCQKSSH
nr:unnamed protein product [Callosobruchus analis]